MHHDPSVLITDLDESVFAGSSQTTSADRRSLLLLQNLSRTYFGKYHYLEIGSHLGGTLVPHLVDPLCSTVLSIDKRPESQPDERAQVFEYDGNSTKRMIDVLKEHVSAVNMLKLVTFDGDVSEMGREILPAKPELILIDGEHTNRAAFSDFIHAYKYAPDTTIIAFHDSNLVMDAILNAETFLRYEERRCELAFLNDQVAVLLIGEIASMFPAISRHALNRSDFLERSREDLNRMIANSVAERERAA